MKHLYNDILDLTSKIENQWLKYNYSSDDFYKVAWETTENFDFSPLGEVSNQLHLMDVASVRYQQHQSTFSDFYFQLFNNGRFMIEILNWWGSQVNVHDHDFSGVQFQLKGESLNVLYDFPETERAGALSFGELTVRNAEIWEEGKRSIVRHGNQDPHSVFHLSSPTTSMLIRTLPTTRYGAQNNYYPTLSAHYYVNSEIQRKKLTGLNLLSTKSPKEFCQLFDTFTATQSLSENFFMFLKLGDVLFSEKYVHLVHAFADRGLAESKVIESVAFNNAIDFFKTKANEIITASEEEKLAIFAVAGSHGIHNFNKIEQDLRNSKRELGASKHLSSFLSKLNSMDQKIAGQYLELFSCKDLLG